MKTLLLSVLVFLAGMCPSFARLGETPAECLKRYGEPINVDKGKKLIFFHKAGLIIGAAFVDGKAVCMTYSKEEKDILDNPVDMSDAERETLLEANGGGRKWEKKPYTKSILMEMWVTTDDVLVAYRDTVDRTIGMAIMTKAYNLQMKAEKAAAEKKALDGI